MLTISKQLKKIADDYNSAITLQQAIRHLQQDVLPNMQCSPCKDEHQKLLQWLIELKDRRQQDKN